MAETQHPLWIEQLSEMDLSNYHWKVFNRVLENDWQNADQNELLEQLLKEIQIRMSAE